VGQSLIAVEVSMGIFESNMKAIVHGSEVYFRAFALADHMCLHTGDIEWICPKQGAAGPSIVYKVDLDEHTIRIRLEEITAEIKAGAIPAFWALSPVSTPPNVRDYLLAAGFNSGSNAEHPEPGMALDLASFSMAPGPKAGLEIIRVHSEDEFAAWIDVVNEALHGWEMLSLTHYRAWLDYPPYAFYLGCQYGKPIATVATLTDGETASIEFVSTLNEHRRRGAGTALCIQALSDLQRQGVRMATLRSSTEAIPVYTRLGFQVYYEQILMSFMPRQPDEC
jgi:ribosomal protein S18 acetylase RimI-like enzyme